MVIEPYNHFHFNPIEMTTQTISPEIQKQMSENIWLDKVLTVALSEIETSLEHYSIYDAIIEVKIESDREYPNWEEIVISVNIPDVNNKNPQELIKMWGVFEDKARKKIAELKNENKTENEEIDEINMHIAIVVDVIILKLNENQ